MLTRGKRRAVPAATTQKSTAKGASSKRSGPPPSKRARTVQNNAGRSHPSQLERQPFAAQAPVPGTSQASPMSSAAVIPALTKAISNAVIQGLTEAGLISNTSVNSGDGAAMTIPIASVQESVADVVEDLTGEGHNNLNPTSLNTLGSLDTNNRPQQVHKLISVPLASRVSEKTQTKIWANEYVELGSLCVSIPSDPKYNFTVNTSAKSNQPVFSLEPAQNSKRINSIDQWTSAFQIFVAVYTVRFPDMAPALMKYSATVRDLAAKNAHWKYYDENFRFLRQKSLFPWDEIHWELWLQAHHMNRNSFQPSSQVSSAKQLKQPFPRGFCWKFHQGDQCFGCNFKHECFKCGASHPAFRCRSSSKPSAATSRTVSAITSANTNSSK